MNLDELQSVRDRERQTDRLQQLRESFYADAGEFIQGLRRERERAAERAAEQSNDPFDSPAVSQLTDEISTAESIVESIYEQRIGKIVKAASFDAAGLPAEADGMTTEEQELFSELVEDIERNRERVLDVIDAGGGGWDPALHEAVGDGDSQPEEASSDSEAEDGGDGPESVESRASESGQSSSRGEGFDEAGEAPHPDDIGDERSDEVDESVPAAAAMGGGDGDFSDVTEGDSGGSPEGGDESDASSGIEAIERKTVQATKSIEPFVGVDGRDYELEENDVVTLPATNADVLLEQDSAREID